MAMIVLTGVVVILIAVFFGGNGSDIAVLSGSANYEGTEILDGGDDYSSADGWIDALTLQNRTLIVADGTVIHWENITIDGGIVSFGTALQVGSDAGLGLTVTNDGILAATSDFTLTGNLMNNAFVTTINDAANNTFIVDGDYSGSGIIALDVVLDDDNSATDRFVITGNNTGSSTIAITNINGNGAQTVNGIQVVQVDGSSTNNFTLAGDYVTPEGNQAVVAGAFAYTLTQKSDGNWYLQTNDGIAEANASTPVLYQPGAPVYESYLQTLQQLTTLPSMDQRFGQRYRGLQHAVTDCISKPDEQVSCPDIDTAAWARVEASQHHIEPRTSTTGAESDIEQWELEVGVDYLVKENRHGRFFMSPTVHYGTADNDVTSRSGNGTVDVKAYGIGMTATWFNNDGFYVDGQARYSWYKSDLVSDRIGSLETNNDGQGYALGVEVGQRFAVNDEVTITPQAQLIHSQVEFDRFTGPNNEAVIHGDSKMLKARLGAFVDQSYKGVDKRGNTYHAQHYFIGNLYYDHTDGSRVSVSGTDLFHEADPFSIEAGVGYRRSWGGDKYVISVDLTAMTGLENIGDSYRYQANTNFTMRF